jgi:hypothetical protein
MTGAVAFAVGVALGKALGVALGFTDFSKVGELVKVGLPAGE